MSVVKPVTPSYLDYIYDLEKQALLPYKPV